MTVTDNVLPLLHPALSREFGGRLVAPGDADYDALRMVMAGDIDRRPAIIARPRTARDVSRAVLFARDNGLELAVRSGGHSGAGHSATEGGLVIDMREMKALAIDEDARTAWAETGLTAGEVSAAVTERGLVVGFGDAATVGIGGITLGGGVGYLSRKHGLTIDSVLAAEIVTADGSIRTIDADSDPDLFWAIRGAGANFGVVTRIKYALNPLPAFTGGMLVLPATPETIDGFLAAAQAGPRELGTIANVMPAPPMPFLKPEDHGKPVILAMLAFAGDDAAAQAALKPFRELATPLADMVKPGPYMQMYPPEDPSYRPVVVMKNRYLGELSPGLGATILDRLGQIGGMRAVQLRVLGGAIADVAPDVTAYAHRAAPAMAQIVAFVDGPDRADKLAWVEAAAAALGPEGSDVAYVNFVGDEGPERVRAAYPGATWDRLRQVKAKYDPANLFRLNQNIPPAA